MSRADHPLFQKMLREAIARLPDSCRDAADHRVPSCTSYNTPEGEGFAVFVLPICLYPLVAALLDEVTGHGPVDRQVLVSEPPLPPSVK